MQFPSAAVAGAWSVHVLISPCCIFVTDNTEYHFRAASVVTVR